jgi:hypothetical protein
MNAKTNPNQRKVKQVNFTRLANAISFKNAIQLNVNTKTTLNYANYILSCFLKNHSKKTVFVLFRKKLSVKKASQKRE